jgi:hypothetical protein
MTAPAVSSPLQPFLTWCEQLGITQKTGRQAVLTNAVKSGAHETALFFLCGQDYIFNPTDLKAQGMENLFIGRGSPYEVNVGGAAVTSFKQIYHPGGAAGGGVRAGGAGNYNLCTKALLVAVQGFGSVFLRDMVKGVAAARTGKTHMTSSGINVELQNMRNHARRFWMRELGEIGL